MRVALHRQRRRDCAEASGEDGSYTAPGETKRTEQSADTVRRAARAASAASVYASRNMRPSTGFTLIELLVTVAVAAILAVVAVPGFRSLIQVNRAATQTNTLVSALTFARSEAIRRGTTVSMCPSSNQTSCTGGTDWSVGWVVSVSYTHLTLPTIA